MHNGLMDTNKATTLLTRAAFGAVIAIPTLLLVNYLEKKVAFKECVMEELMGSMAIDNLPSSPTASEVQAAITTSTPR